MKDDSDSAYFAGRITWWNGNSYGFITPDGSTAEDVFVHRSELPEDYEVKVGDRVTYRIASDRRRPERAHAVDVRAAA